MRENGNSDVSLINKELRRTFWTKNKWMFFISVLCHHPGAASRSWNLLLQGSRAAGKCSWLAQTDAECTYYSG